MPFFMESIATNSFDITATNLSMTTAVSILKTYQGDCNLLYFDFDFTNRAELFVDGGPTAKAIRLICFIIPGHFL